MQSKYYKLHYIQYSKLTFVELVHERELAEWKQRLERDMSIKGGYARNEGDQSVIWLKR